MSSPLSSFPFFLFFPRNVEAKPEGSFLKGKKKENPQMDMDTESTDELEHNDLSEL